MKKVILIYVGPRARKNGTVQLYEDVATGNDLTFKKKLLGYESIGGLIETYTENEMNYKDHKWLGFVNENNYPDYVKEVTRWTTEHRALIERKKVESEAKKAHSESSEELIIRLRDSMSMLPSAQRKVFALYVYSKLLQY